MNMNITCIFFLNVNNRSSAIYLSLRIVARVFSFPNSSFRSYPFPIIIARNSLNSKREIYRDTKGNPSLILNHVPTIR